MVVQGDIFPKFSLHPDKVELQSHSVPAYSLFSRAIHETDTAISNARLRLHFVASLFFMLDEFSLSRRSLAFENFPIINAYIRTCTSSAYRCYVHK